VLVVYVPPINRTSWSAIFSSHTHKQETVKRCHDGENDVVVNVDNYFSTGTIFTIELLSVKISRRKKKISERKKRKCRENSVWEEVRFVARCIVMRAKGFQ